MPVSGTEVNMKKAGKRTTVIILCAIMSLTGVMMSGCGKAEKTDNGGQRSESSEVVEKAGTIIPDTDSELTIIDQAGREVTVKKNPETIALCYRVVIRFLLSLDQGDKIKGIGKSEDFLEELQPSLADCVDVGKGVADIEAIAELKPDLFIHKASDVDTLEAVEKIGIPAVGVDVETPAQMMTALEILGRVCGAEEKAEELRKYYDDRLRVLDARTSELADEDRPRAIVMGSSIGKVADGTMLQGTMLEDAGGTNCAAELEATELWPTAGVEQIFAWDPEYIFITGSESAVYTAEDILKDKAWAEVSAVKSGHVYTIPAKEDSWEFPGTVSILGIEYMMNVMHPDLLSTDELDAHVKEFYELSYDRTFSREELGY